MASTREKQDVDLPLSDIAPDPEQSARAANLIYVTDEMPGIRRKRWGRGFTYISPEGEHISDPEERQRFESFAIPPAWTDVWICPLEDGHLQVTGRDDKGRKQYIYHPRWQAIREETKYHRLLLFSEALPPLRSQIDEDLRRHGLPRQRIIAVVVRLLDETLIRIGNSEYARNNQSYGLTTLRDEHLEVSTTKLRFHFRGKAGKMQAVDITDRRAARVLQQCQELPGQELFQYLDEEGQRRALSSTDVNAYLRSAMGEAFTAKDFRTWGGTVCAAGALKRMGPAESEAVLEKNLAAAVARAAERLGNTTTICRQYYVHPAIPAAYEEGWFFDEWEKPAEEDSWLQPDEQVVQSILRRYLS